MIRALFTISLLLTSVLPLKAQWDLLTTEDTAYLYTAIHMPADSFIVAGGFYDDGTAAKSFVVRTTNQGVSWDTTVFNLIGNITAIHFPTLDTGYFGSSAGALYMTIDSGGTWSELWPALVTHPVEDLDFISSSKGYGTNANGENIFIYTSDAGQNWTHTDTISGETVDFPSDTVGFMASGPGFIMTTDGANSWTTHVGLLERLYFSADFPSETIGWLGGMGQGSLNNKGVITKTSNFGQDWDYWDFEILSDIHSIKAPSPDIVYATSSASPVLNESIVLKTEDGGATWGYQLYNNSTFNPFVRRLYCLNDTVCAAAGFNGQIFFTTNGGGPLIPLSTPSIAPSTRLKLYPNPCENNVTIELENISESSVVIEVIDMKGAILQRHDVSQSISNFTLNVEDLPAGIYHIKVSGNATSINQRLVKL